VVERPEVIIFTLKTFFFLFVVATHLPSKLRSSPWNYTMRRDYRGQLHSGIYTYRQEGLSGEHGQAQLCYEDITNMYGTDMWCRSVPVPQFGEV
jgi:hypothetical protein